MVAHPDCGPGRQPGGRRVDQPSTAPRPEASVVPGLGRRGDHRAGGHRLAAGAEVRPHLSLAGQRAYRQRKFARTFCGSVTVAARTRVKSSSVSAGS
ncbi:hypothetical protein ACFFX0_22285 [Citricoccus parietis]|uniref:Uncharacterized protein n=1 Tax=Citricoccus parietis TaxID=592307 RepID=A0ABV5G4C0_9MICC